jgi:hypothetical protein
LAGFGAVAVAALNTYKKKFFKKVTTKSNCAKMSTPQTTELNHENEAGDSGH